MSIQATLHQLVVFEAVARHGSFTRAAAELNITQPTVSGQVRQLAKAIQMPLFEQVGKSLYLTEAGQALLEACHEVFAALENFEMKVADIKGTKQGQLRLAAVTTAKYFVPRLLGAFCQKYPEIDVALKMMDRPSLLRRMGESVDDLYIVSEPPEEVPGRAVPFMINPLVVIARRDHHLAGQEAIPVDKLTGEAFVMREKGSATREAVEALLHRYGVWVKVKLELDSNEAIKQAIAGGLGISVLSRYALISESSDSEFTILPVEHFPIKRHWHAFYRHGKHLSVVAKSFLDFLVSEGKHFVEEHHLI